MSRPIAFLKLTRFPLVFTAAADSAVGAALAGVPLLESARWVPAVLASCFLYAAGMVLNDVVDLDRDRTLHPERPLPSGRVSQEAAVRFTFLLFGLAIVAALVSGGPALVWTAAMCVLIAAYNAAFKRNAVAGSLAMAVVRGANLGLGAVAAGGDPRLSSFPWIPIVILAGYVFVLTLWSTREDDPKGNRGLLAVLGVGMLAVPLAGAGVQVRWPAALPSLWIFPWIVRAMLRPERARLMQVVRWGVLGIILLDASFLAVRARWIEAGAVAALIVPALVLLPVFRKL